MPNIAYFCQTGLMQLVAQRGTYATIAETTNFYSDRKFRILIPISESNTPLSQGSDKDSNR